MPTDTTPSNHRKLWLKQQRMRDEKFGYIVRQIENSEETHRIRLAIQVNKTQPGAAYTPIRFKQFRKPWWRRLWNAV